MATKPPTRLYQDVRFKWHFLEPWKRGVTVDLRKPNMVVSACGCFIIPLKTPASDSLKPNMSKSKNTFQSITKYTHCIEEMYSLGSNQPRISRDFWDDYVLVHSLLMLRLVQPKSRSERSHIWIDVDVLQVAEISQQNRGISAENHLCGRWLEAGI